MDNTWFPITGNLILRNNKPIASVPNNKEAYELMDALANYNRGTDYTCISNDGWYTKRIEPTIEKAEKDE